MRYDKLTSKFQSILQTAQSSAMAADHAYVEAAHVVQALLDDHENGMAALLVQAGGNVSQIKQKVQAALSALPNYGRMVAIFPPAANCKTRSI